MHQGLGSSEDTPMAGEEEMGRRRKGPRPGKDQQGLGFASTRGVQAGWGRVGLLLQLGGLDNDNVLEARNLKHGGRGTYTL